MFIDVVQHQIVFTPTGELERTGKIMGIGCVGRVTIGVKVRLMLVGAGSVDA